ncbi:hypothetical protein HanIR_Chr10g0489381 [Helianthus annuus]|nr:hypothetical protein HanIR_Chr10g0489381 [Helianthus annuus]
MVQENHPPPRVKNNYLYPNQTLHPSLSLSKINVSLTATTNGTSHHTLFPTTHNNKVIDETPVCIMCSVFCTVMTIKTLHLTSQLSFSGQKTKTHGGRTGGGWCTLCFWRENIVL